MIPTVLCFVEPPRLQQKVFYFVVTKPATLSSAHLTKGARHPTEGGVSGIAPTAEDSGNVDAKLRWEILRDTRAKLPKFQMIPNRGNHSKNRACLGGGKNPPPVENFGEVVDEIATGEFVEILPQAPNVENILESAIALTATIEISECSEDQFSIRWFTRL
eukprot:c20813_g1_i5.p1 GENE.c20813_g1_i5~~c20813_g1_i5.p1  ORF type:complete len:161 (+),score=35.16 c20813_g1_i5:248-730(+)